MKTFLLIAFTIAMFAYGFHVYISIPYVHKSYSTKECLFIEYSDGSTSDCTKIPERYDLVWHK